MGNALRYVSQENQKNIVRILEGLTGAYSRWDIWRDFIIMSAVSIANVIGGPYRDKREELYLTHAGKYSPKDIQAFPAMFYEIVAAMENDPENDFLGELFMVLGMGNEWKGQVFTPYSLCRMMATMTYGKHVEEQIKQDGWITVNDPACGAGALLIAFANECRQRQINYQTSVLFVAQDIDLLAGCMCYIQLSLMGCPGYVVIDDTLLHPSMSHDKRGLLPQNSENVWFTPMYFRDIWHHRRICAKMDLCFQSAAAPSLKAAGNGPQKQPIKTGFASTKTGQLTLF